MRGTERLLSKRSVKTSLLLSLLSSKSVGQRMSSVRSNHAKFALNGFRPCASSSRVELFTCVEAVFRSKASIKSREKQATGPSSRTNDDYASDFRLDKNQPRYRAPSVLHVVWYGCYCGYLDFSDLTNWNSYLRPLLMTVRPQSPAAFLEMCITSPKRLLPT